MYNPAAPAGLPCRGRRRSEQLHPAGRVAMAFSERDRGFMQRALALAEGGRGYVEPNPMVGALIVKDDRVVAEGHHGRFGGPHAEVVALREAGERSRGATMYVTLEPCDHYGKTRPCAPLVADAGLSRVVIAALDPTAAKPAGGVDLLRQRGLNVHVGLCRDEAVRLNAGFFKLAATGRPLVIAKWAMSADGKIAARAGSARWISSDEAREMVHQLRGRVDCVIIGSRTALSDDPLMTCRNAERRRTATRLVLCGRTVPPADSQLVRTVDRAPVLLAHPQSRRPPGLELLTEMGCEALPVEQVEGPPGRVGLGGLLDELGRRRMTNVLVEGGGEALGGFFDAGLVDRVMIFVAPLIIGGADATPAVAGTGVEQVEKALKLQDCRTTSVGPDVLIQGWVTDPLTWAP